MNEERLKEIETRLKRYEFIAGMTQADRNREWCDLPKGEWYGSTEQLAIMETYPTDIAYLLAEVKRLQISTTPTAVTDRTKPLSEQIAFALQAEDGQSTRVIIADLLEHWQQRAKLIEQDLESEFE